MGRVLKLKDGSMETILEPEDTLKIVRDHLGDEVTDVLAEYVEDMLWEVNYDLQEAREALEEVEQELADLRKGDAPS